MKSVFNITVARMWEASPTPVLGRLALAFLLVTTSLTNAKEATQPKRARPPKWTPDVVDVFFADARTKLVGNRPDYDQSAPVATAPASPADPDTSPDNRFRRWLVEID